MSQMPESPATAPIPVQLSEPEFIAFIFPQLSMPRRGPKCKLGYHRVFNLILWVATTYREERGRWHRLLRPQTPEGREGRRDRREQRLCVGPASGGAGK